MNSRTDLALECMDFAGEASLQGLEHRRFTQGQLACEEVTVSSPQAAERMGKPVGRYLTADPAPFARDSGVSFQEAEDLADCLKSLLPEGCHRVLVAGLGNRSITPDAYGPRVADQILVTRHLPGSLTKEIGLEGSQPGQRLCPRSVGTNRGGERGTDPGGVPGGAASSGGCGGRPGLFRFGAVGADGTDERRRHCPRQRGA